MTSPSFTPYPDAAALQAAIAPWLAQDPVPFALVCGVAGLIANGGWCGVISVAGDPVLAMVQTPGKPALIASPHRVEGAVARLAAAVIRERQAPGVNGPTAWAEAISEASAEAISEASAAAQPGAVTARMGIRLHRLDGPPRLPTPTAGEARQFTAAELPVLQAFMLGFSTDAGLKHPERTPEQIAAMRGDFLAWTVADRPVAMARRARPLLGGWSIGSVYTPAHLRGRGYGGAVVHALSALLLAEGARYVALYTDLANPVSNRLYARIGFVPLLDQTEITWAAP